MEWKPKGKEAREKKKKRNVNARKTRTYETCDESSREEEKRNAIEKKMKDE